MYRRIQLHVGNKLSHLLLFLPLLSLVSFVVLYSLSINHVVGSSQMFSNFPFYVNISFFFSFSIQFLFLCCIVYNFSKHQTFQKFLLVSSMNQLNFQLHTCTLQLSSAIFVEILSEDTA